MGKTGKWIKNFLLGKKDKHKDKDKSSANHHSDSAENQATPISFPPTTPKEKRRWSFRRSSATGPAVQKDSDSISVTAPQAESEQTKHVVSTISPATVATAVLIHMNDDTQESAAATKIQSVFRSYLARKALSALKGLVKLQALVRGHLVRKQATATLRCMQALVTVQERARAQRIRMSDDPNNNRASFNSRNTTPERRSRTTHYELEENIKIVEMDQSGSSTKNRTPTRRQSDPRFQQNSPAPTVMTEMSPRASSGYYFEEYSPHYYSAVSKPDPSRVPFRPEYAESMSYEYPSFPSYMANTESSRAKVRSQSAPKQRSVETFEKPLIRRRPSIEGRNVPRAVRMQRSSSHVGSTVHNYQYPWSVKLDKSLVSLKDSECGSNSTMLTDINYCRSLIAFDEQGNRNY